MQLEKSYKKIVVNLFLSCAVLAFILLIIINFPEYPYVRYAWTIIVFAVNVYLLPIAVIKAFSQRALFPKAEVYLVFLLGINVYSTVSGKATLMILFGAMIGFVFLLAVWISTLRCVWYERLLGFIEEKINANTRK